MYSKRSFTWRGRTEDAVRPVLFLILSSADLFVRLPNHPVHSHTSPSSPSSSLFLRSGPPQTSVRHFVFAPLSLVSDADEATSFTEAGLKALGSIELRIWRGRVVGAAPSPEDEGGEEGEKALPEIGGKAIWEQSKKLETGKHQAGCVDCFPHSRISLKSSFHSLGPARPSFDTAPRASFEFVAELDPVETPWISFEWRYKDRGTLCSFSFPFCSPY